MLPPDTNLQALRTEAEALAALLRAEVRLFASKHRSVQLEPGAPAAAGLLWQTVGWFEVFGKTGLVPPELDTSERGIEERLDDYESWGEGFTLTAAELPARRRLVEDDGAGVGFLVTDESGGALDAPVLAVLADTNEVIPSADSYTRWCANLMVRCALSRMYQTFVRTRPRTALASLGSPPFPLLSPATRQLSPDVFSVPSSGGALEPHSNGGYRLAHRSVEALVALLENVDLDALDLGLPLPGDHLHVHATVSQIQGEGESLRRFTPLEPGSVCAVAILAGVPVILREVGGWTDVHANPRRIAELNAALRWR